MRPFLVAIHFHQPVGNFDSVFRRAFDQAYLPFLQTALRFPIFRFALHISGPLLEWLRDHKKKFFDGMEALIDRNQIEILGGGFYEPVLPSIPFHDALGQIEMMSDFWHRYFGIRPKGLWLAERIWDPQLPSLLKRAGILYTLVEDTHLIYGGKNPDRLGGYYVTESLGDTVNLFPIDKELRYLIPHRSVKEAVESLRRPALPAGCALTFGDDGEKFGLWPGSHKRSYGEKWLPRFFELLGKSQNWLYLPLFSEYLRSQKPSGRVYVPDCAYEEMLEWALPPSASCELSALKTHLDRTGHREGKRFIRAGVFNHFFEKYEKSHLVHQRMLYVSRIFQRSARIAGIRRSVAYRRGLRELYRSQCNCSYWHGFFGGHYLPHLRDATTSHLIAAENIADALAKTQGADPEPMIDIDCDGREEVVLKNPHYICWVKPAQRGAILSLDLRKLNMNLTNVISRRPEAYHGDIDRREQRKLCFDSMDRMSSMDRFTKSAPRRSQMRAETFEDDSLDGNVTVEKVLPQSIEMRHIQGVWAKRISIAGKTLSIGYQFINTSLHPVSGWLSSEFNISLLSPREVDGWMEVWGKKGRKKCSGSRPASFHGVERVSVISRLKRFRLQFLLAGWSELWTYPVQTLTRSESGFEWNYQGTCLIFGKKVKLPPGEIQEFKMELRALEP
jgi:alpha-amylase